MKTLFKEMVISEVLQAAETGVILDVPEAVDQLKAHRSAKGLTEAEIETAVVNEAIARGVALRLDRRELADNNPGAPSMD